jgi:hypothetical protein
LILIATDSIFLLIHSGLLNSLETVRQIAGIERKLSP